MDKFNYKAYTVLMIILVVLSVYMLFFTDMLLLAIIIPSLIICIPYILLVINIQKQRKRGNDDE